MEPRPEGLVGKETMQGAIRVQEPFLDGVFGILMREDNRPRDRVRATLLQTHQRRKGLVLAPLGSQHEHMLALAVSLLSVGHDPSRQAADWGSEGSRNERGRHSVSTERSLP